MAELVVDLAGILHRIRDFLAEQVAVALAKAVDADLDGVFGHSELGGDLAVRRRRLAAAEESAENPEAALLLVADPFRPQAGERALEDRVRPLPLEHRLRRERVRRLGEVAAFGGLRVERDDP